MQISFVPLESLLVILLPFVTVGNGGEGGDVFGITAECFLVMLYRLVKPGFYIRFERTEGFVFNGCDRVGQINVAGIYLPG